ncbi:MAG: heme exporter protein CcmB [Burkholderiaceae bacterium]|jgi:heme exporter protein B|nr:heme exporter protein CcmB [Burkholderiaceae bacterium]MEB2320819.1 heme exporter protein CcmB [Pseudomonadota bacterium]
MTAGAAIRWGLRRDLALAMRSRAEIAIVLVFFLLVTSLFPLGLDPDPALLAKIAPGIAWVAALLASLLGLPRLFAADHADGSLEQLALAAAPLPALVTGKVLAHWVATSLPLILLAPLAGIQFGLEPRLIGILIATLLLGTPVLAWLGAIGAALTLGARGGAALLALLVLPLAVPVLVFGAGAVESTRAGLGAQAHLSLLGAGAILSTVFGPFVTALAVRISFE